MKTSYRWWASDSMLRSTLAIPPSLEPQSKNDILILSQPSESSNLPYHRVMNTLQTMGASFIRSQTLGIGVDNPLSIMPALGVYNEEALATIYWSVFQARQHGLSIMTPLIDHYFFYHGSCQGFMTFRGVNTMGSESGDHLAEEFCTNATIIQDFKNCIEKLVTHVNPYTGLTYGEDPTIFAYETGNEFSGPTSGDMDVPVEWTAEISVSLVLLHFCSNSLNSMLSMPSSSR